MNKASIKNILHNSMDTYRLCRCYFKYHPDYWYFFILNYSDKLFLGIEETDFLLDGFQIRKISDLQKIENKNDLCVKIIEENALLAEVKKPEINLLSWKTVFESLKSLNIFLIVENEKTDNSDDFFYLGKIQEIKNSFIVFSAVDADGIWYDNIKIPYSKITSITFNDRYSKTWQQYLSR